MSSKVIFRFGDTTVTFERSEADQLWCAEIEPTGREPIAVATRQRQQPSIPVAFNIYAAWMRQQLELKKRLGHPCVAPLYRY